MCGAAGQLRAADLLLTDSPDTDGGGAVTICLSRTCAADEERSGAAAHCWYIAVRQSAADGSVPLSGDGRLARARATDRRAAHARRASVPITGAARH